MGRMLSFFLLVAACDASDVHSEAVDLADDEKNAARTFIDGGYDLGRDGGGDETARQRTGDADASTKGGAADRQTVEHPTNDDARTRVIALLEETNRGARITCPCHVENGAFSSEEACFGTIGYTESLIKCLSDSIAQSDRPSLRALLACEAKRIKQRNDCHQEAACAENEVNDCDESQPDCPPPDAEALTRALSDCPGAGVFSR